MCVRELHSGTADTDEGEDEEDKRNNVNNIDKFPHPAISQRTETRSGGLPLLSVIGEYVLCSNRTDVAWWVYCPACTSHKLIRHKAFN